MSQCMAMIRYYGADGYPVSGGGLSIFLPDYLDWMSIELKAVWFLKRGYGPPATTSVLIESQGEQMLVTPLPQPLSDMHHTQLTENENGLEDWIGQYARENGISRTPRNQ